MPVGPVVVLLALRSILTLHLLGLLLLLSGPFLYLLARIVHGLTHLHGFIVALPLLHVGEHVLNPRVIRALKDHIILLVNRGGSLSHSHLLLAILFKPICHVERLITSLRVYGHVSFQS